ncbi:MAG: NHL repeat-containing protein [Vulcanimicrobiaceae bacterium]
MAMKNRRFCSALGALGVFFGVLVLASCGGGSVTPLATMATPTPTPRTMPTATATATATASATPTPTPTPSGPAAGTTYVFTDASSPYGMEAFAPNATGAATPVSSFTFSSSNYISGIAVDATGRVYVDATNSIFSFAYGAGGSATPSTTLTSDPYGWGLAIDASDDLVATDYHNNVVDFFAPGANASAAPIKQIGGSSTQLNYPYQAAFDGSGNLYVLNANIPSITEYSAASISGTGTINAAPIAVITSSSSALDGPEGLAVDLTGRIYVGNSANNTISVFAPGSNGNVSPAATLNGSNIGFSINQATIAVDSSNDLYVASSNSSNAVYVFAPVTSSGQTPIRTITGVTYAGGVGIVP